MIGWEFPPNNSGGLGVACQGIVENLVDSGESLVLVLPRERQNEKRVEEIAKTPNGNEYRVIYIKSLLRPYIGKDGVAYSGDLFSDVSKYAEMVLGSLGGVEFNIVHVHDWLTVPAGIAIKEKYDVPMVLHVHSTEYDRTAGGGENKKVGQIEKAGFNIADLIITVSKYTKQVLTEEYKVPSEKIMVVHNGVTPLSLKEDVSIDFLKGSPVVVFVGRLTIQKGPEYFIEVARKVIARRPEAIFIFAGDGDMLHHLLLTSAYKSLSGSVLFAGFLRGEAMDKLYKRADIFMMPSVSEPFGIVALEAAMANTAVIVSKTSGVSEVLPSAIKVDFWDTELMASKILDLIEKTDIKRDYIERVKYEAGAITWGNTAIKIKDAYCQLLSKESV